MTFTAAVPESDLHRAARKRLAAKAGAWRFAALWVVLALLFNASCLPASLLRPPVASEGEGFM